MKKHFDTFLALQGLYEEYYEMFNSECSNPNHAKWHILTDPKDWVWYAFYFNEDKWFDLADKWEIEYLKLTT